MRNMRLLSYTSLVLWLAFCGLTTTLLAGPEVSNSSTITMKSPATFMVNDREVASADLIKALKKNKISPDYPLVIELPANTSMEIIKDLTQRLATAGFKPFFKYPRHSDAIVKDPKSPPLTPAPHRKRRDG
ncbi:MAG: hypothetical protein WCI03_08505 [bacterium]